MVEKQKTVKKCPYCGYEWILRISNPKSCPRCKRRFDYPLKRKSEDDYE